MKTGSKIVISCFAVISVVLASCISDSDDIPDPNEQLQKDIALIDSYLATNNITAIADKSGIRYVVHFDSIGGKKPTIDSCVTADYVGKLLANGQKFDDGENISFPLGSVIDGWKIGIPLLNEGDSATLYIPSGFAYGYYGYPPQIPRNANLIFHVAIRKVGSTYRETNNVGSCN